MRTLVIGDIHGCLAQLDLLLAAITPMPGEKLVILGDYIDRGPDSAGVLDRLIQLSKTLRLVPILGNHEQMLLEARDNPEKLGEWVLCGGAETLKSYGAAAREIEKIPERHFQFLEQDCVNFYETATHISRRRRTSSPACKAKHNRAAACATESCTHG